MPYRILLLTSRTKKAGDSMMDAKTEALVARLTKERDDLKARVAELEDDRQRLINQAGTCCDED